MLQYGLQKQATPSIWLLIPIMTLLGIEWVRMQHGLSHHFATPVEQGQVVCCFDSHFYVAAGALCCWGIV